MLAGVPARLTASCPWITAGPLFTPARTTIGVTWCAVALAVAAGGITLRSTVAYAQKRSRFASAVTHELRTPLTTFRMYSEMLAEGMVSDESQRRAYLETLKAESARLAALVENVLSYARLEDGRPVAHSAQPITGPALVERLLPPLRRRAAEAGMDLVVEDRVPSSRLLTIDADAVGQVLFNLVDNACKYAAGSDDNRIHLSFGLEADQLVTHVRDHGPGIAAEHARIIFAPFERGAHGPGDAIPGVGLGLALCRGLARDLKGDLRLERPADRVGACFVFTASASG